jgi:hypothetical protein
MHPIGRDVSSHSKHPGRFVPHMHRTKMENIKLMKIKKGTSRREILNKSDIRQLKAVYKFALNAKKEVKLGNTGITIKWHKGNFFLMR